ncbi:hypothetical protein P7C73_g4772, partial [Tremellales sp. Uapishka_1]
MDRSSSRKNLKAERLAVTPYDRPDTPKKNTPKKDTPTASFSALRSIYSLISSPFKRSPPALPVHSSSLRNQLNVAVSPAQRSESGSEDNWDGEAPHAMAGQDVFSLAAAGGRDRDQFEERAETWRAREEIPGGRRDLARRGLETSTPGWTDSTPSYLHATVKSSQTMSHPAPLLHKGLPSRAPLPTFTSPPQSSATPRAPPATAESDPASAALLAFLEAKAKKGEQFTSGDLGIINYLTRVLEDKPANTPATPNLGGWSAGTFSSSPRVGGQGASTPQKPLSSLNPSFSLGSNGPSATTPRSRPHIKYLGPGMSPKNMYPSQRKSGCKSSVPSEPDAEEVDTPDNIRKRKRVEEIEAMDLDDPDPPTLKLTSTSKHAIKPPPTPREQEIARKAKKSVADIMKEIIDADIGPLKPAPPPMMINPYDLPNRSPIQSSPAQSPGQLRSSGLRNSVSRIGTPTRGAAGKLEKNKNVRRLNTLEILTGEKPYHNGAAPPSSKDQSKQVPFEAPIKGHDDMQIDPSLAFPSPSSTPLPKGTPSSSAPTPAMPRPLDIPPFTVPSLPVSTADPTTAVPTTGGYAEAYADLVDTYAPKKTLPSPKRKFSPAKYLPSPPSRDEVSPPPVPVKSRSAKQPMDLEHIYLNPKDSCLKIPKLALPFYTFTMRSPLPDTANVGAAKAEANKRTAPSFTFTLSASSSSLPTVSAAKEWICDVCMLKNPATATEQCTVCEAKKPFAAPAKSSSTPMPLVGASSGNPSAAPSFKPILPSLSTSGGEWTCDTCMLKNPATATEKCTICEAKKPASAPAPSTFVPWTGGMPVQKKKEGEWTCGTCMLQNPASATEKCTVCEMPR